MPTLCANTKPAFAQAAQALDQLCPVRGVTRGGAGGSVSFGGQSISGFRSHFWKTSAVSQSKSREARS